MSFYPLFNINENSGFVQLANFAPNNWEKVSKGMKSMYSLLTTGQNWQVKNLGTISENEFCTYKTSDFLFEKPIEKDGVIIEELMLFQMRNDLVSGDLMELPSFGLPSTLWPEWRATIGFDSSNSRVSYQGEINPTPSKAT